MAADSGIDKSAGNGRTILLAKARSIGAQPAAIYLYAYSVAFRALFVGEVP